MTALARLCFTTTKPRRGTAHVGRLLVRVDAAHVGDAQRRDVLLVVGHEQDDGVGQRPPVERHSAGDGRILDLATTGNDPNQPETADPHPDANRNTWRTHRGPSLARSESRVFQAFSRSWPTPDGLEDAGIAGRSKGARDTAERDRVGGRMPWRHGAVRRRPLADERISSRKLCGCVTGDSPPDGRSSRPAVSPS